MHQHLGEIFCWQNQLKDTCKDKHQEAQHGFSTHHLHKGL